MVVVFFLKQWRHILNACIATCAVVVVVLECTCYNGGTCMVCMVVIAGSGNMQWLYIHVIVAVWCGGGHMWWWCQWWWLYLHGIVDVWCGGGEYM